MSLPVIVCIGSSGVVGDSLGPMVADLLRAVHKLPAYVYGGLRRPVNGLNYRRYKEFLLNRHPENFVIAVDACVGAEKDVGTIKYSAGGLRAGGALNKDLGKIGDIGILGVVAATLASIVSNLTIGVWFWYGSADVIMPLMIPAVIPFNLAKTMLNSVLTLVVYKAISNLITPQKDQVKGRA